MAYRSSSTSQGNSGTPSTAVPAGAASGDIAILALNFDRGSGTITWPAGFTEFATLRCTAEGHTNGCAWKRLSAGDSGTYDITFTGGATDWVCQCALFSGRHATDPPVATSVTQNTLQASPVTINGADITALAGDDLFWVSGPDVNGSGIATGPALHTVPSGYTERQDAENAWANLCIGTRDNVSAGATGVVAGSISLNISNAGYNTFHGRIPVAAGGGGGGIVTKAMILQHGG
jgi:hypothetical protein